MSIKPILFNTEMVRNLLEGRKTVTRRVMKPQPYTVCDHGGVHDFVTDDFGFKSKSTGFVCRKCGYGVSPPHYKYPCGTSFFRPPYNQGDILYVRETWNKVKLSSESEWHYEYRASCENPAYFRDGFMAEWRPSIHMPKKAARLFLRVTDVRVERLQDIDEEGAKEEGVNFQEGKHVGVEEKMRRSAVARFSQIWNRTIKPSDIDLYGWYANPWVWVIEFERCEKPDEVKSNG